MPKFYATLCIEDGGGYVTIEAPDMEAAKRKMFASLYGRQWAFMYDETGRYDSIDRFNQKEMGTL